MPWAFFTPTPSHNNNSVMCTFYHFIIPYLLHSGLVLLCPGGSPEGGVQGQSVCSC